MQLTSSKIYPYVINPYVGGQHACSYCYAGFMKRFTGHTEPWGEFVDVKVNAAELLRTEVNLNPAHSAAAPFVISSLQRSRTADPETML